MGARRYHQWAVEEQAGDRGNRAGGRMEQRRMGSGAGKPGFGRMGHGALREPSNGDN